MGGHAIEKILIFRVDALGDTILTTPLICQVRKSFPGARITVVASGRGFPALQGLREIDDIIILSPQDMNLRSSASLASELKNRNITASLNVSEKIWGYLVPYLAGVPVRVGFWPGITQPIKSLMCSPLLTHRVYYPNDPRNAPGEHEVERHMRLLEPLGVSEAPGPLRVNVDEEARVWVQEYLKGKRDLSRPILAALHLSSKWLTDGWEIGFLESLLGSIQQYHAVQLLLTYGEAEKRWAEGFLEHARRSFSLIPFFNPSFACWAAALQCSRLLITMDTSASHVASAVGVPVIDIFPEAYYAHCTGRWYPWRVVHRLVERRSLSEVEEVKKRGEISEDFQVQVLKCLRELLELP